MGLVPDQFKRIPPDTLPYEWGELKEYSFGETKIPAKYRELIGAREQKHSAGSICAAKHPSIFIRRLQQD